MSGTLVMIVGFSGTGKSTIAARLSKVIDESIILDPDDLRRDCDFTVQGSYNLYMDMYRMAEDHLVSGKVVLWPQPLSRHWGDPGHPTITGRVGLIRLAKSLGASWRIIHCQVPDEILLERLEVRGEERSPGGDEQTWGQVLYRLRHIWESIDAPHLVIDSSGAVDLLPLVTYILDEGP